MLLPQVVYSDSEVTVGGRTGTAKIWQDEGTSLRPRPYVNMIGAGVTCTDSGGKTVCTISGGGGSGSGDITRVGDCLSGECLVSGGNVTTDSVYATNNIHIGGAASSSFKGAGDLYATSGIKAMEGLFAEAGAYGAGLEISDEGLTVTRTNVVNKDATLTAATQIITDTHASFTDAYEGQFFRVITATAGGSPGQYIGATGEITEVIDGTHLVLSFATAGGAAIIDATAMWYVIYPHPRFFVGDNGVISANVGVDPEAKFEIHVDDGQGFHGVYVEDTAGADQHQGLTVDTDTKGFDGVVGHNIYMESSAASTSDSVATTSLEINEDNYTTSELNYIEVRKIGSGTSNDINVIQVEGLATTDHLMHIGQPNTIERAYYDDGDGTTSDVTTGFTSQGTDETLMENDNAIIYMANETEEFTFIGLAFSTESNRNINAEYYYCSGDDTWVTLPGVTDTTDGMKTSGSISFSNPGDRGLCDEEIDSTAFADTTDRAYIAIKRTRNNWSGDYPIENIISIGGASYMYMDSYGTKPIGSAGAPYSCTASEAGMSYYDSTAVALLWCDGATWNEYAETTDITVHNNLSGLQGGTATEYYHLTSSEHVELNAWLDDVTLVNGGGITTRVCTTASTTSWTIDADSYDQCQQTALAGALTVNAPSGTETNGQKLIIKLTDNGTARGITWNAAFRSAVTLPTTTTVSKTLYVGFIWDSTDSKWDCLAVSEEQ